jgi:hypothetical protein
MLIVDSAEKTSLFAIFWSGVAGDAQGVASGSPPNNAPIGAFSAQSIVEI